MALASRLRSNNKSMLYHVERKINNEWSKIEIFIYSLLFLLRHCGFEKIKFIVVVVVETGGEVYRPIIQNPELKG